MTTTGLQITKQLPKPSKLIIQIYPKPEELSTIKTDLKCPEELCKNKIFPNIGALELHRIKTHRKSSNSRVATGLDYDGNEEFQYFCPGENCIYGNSGTRSFKTWKLVKQHYLKVHAAKTIECPKCSKKFSASYMLSAHLRSCGITFECVCGLYYNSYEAILTHSRRTGHAVDQKYKKKSTTADQTSTTSLSNPQNIPLTNQPCTKPTMNILPKPGESYPVHIMAAIALSELSRSCLAPKVDVGIQTDIASPNEGKRCIRKAISPGRSTVKKSKQCAETQTIVRTRQPKRSAETQTSCNNETKKAKVSKSSQCSSKVSVRKRKSCIATQTLQETKVSTEPEVKNPTETTLDINEWLAQSTETDPNETSEIETFFNSWDNLLDVTSDQQTKQSQTQTEFHITDYIFGGETCENFEDNEFFNDMSFSNIQTQTTWPFVDNLVSTETQTQHTSNIDFLPNLEMTDMETQTADLEDLMML